MADPIPTGAQAAPQQTSTGSTLQAMSNNVPVANQRLASQQQAARDMQMQQAVGAAAPAQATAQNAQQIGTQQAQNAGTQQVAAQAQAGQQQAQVAQIGQQVQQLKDTQAVNDSKLGENQQVEANAEAFSQISLQAKQEMYDERRDFATTQQGLQFTNERQLADYAKLRAQTDQQWLSYVQTTNDLEQKKTQTLTTAYNKISQTMQIENAAAIQARQQAADLANKGQENSAQLQIYKQKLEQAQQLRQAQVDLAKSIAKNQAKQAGNLMKNQAMGQVAGMAIGAAAVVLAPATFGTSLAVGAAVGGAAGSGAMTLGQGSKPI